MRRFRTIRPLIAAVAIALTSATTAAALSVRFHDFNLDLAAAAIEKSVVLLQSTVCGNPGEKNTADCEKSVDKAISDLERAGDEIALAIVASDGGTH